MSDLLLELFSGRNPCADCKPRRSDNCASVWRPGWPKRGLRMVRCVPLSHPDGWLLSYSTYPTPNLIARWKKKARVLARRSRPWKGFCRSAGLKKEALEVRGEGKDACYFAVIHEQGKPTADTLKPLIETILEAFHWPKSQRWGAHDMHWVRPLPQYLLRAGQ